MTWVHEQPRRAVALGLVCFVVVVAAVGMGGALAGGETPIASTGASTSQEFALRRELGQSRRRAARAERLMALQTPRVRYWRARAKRAAKQLQRQR